MSRRFCELRKNIFITAEEAAEMLGVSKPYAYKLIKKLNEELQAKGYFTIAGKVSRRYFEEKFYGMEGDECACV